MIFPLRTLVLIFLLAATAGAESRLRFDIVPGVGYSFGTARYRMEGTTVISQLDFPLDQPVGGGRIELARLRDGRPDWSVTAEVTTALGDPHGTFDDRDWYVLGDGSEELFSTTRSHVEGSLIRLRGEVCKRAFHGPNWDIAVFAGLVYHGISQTAIDVAGSQIVSDSAGNGRWVEFDFEARALTYDLDVYQSLVGLAPRLYVEPRVVVEARLAVSPILYVKDLDDHILRGFTSKADGYGFGWSTRLMLRYEPVKNRRGGGFSGYWLAITIITKWTSPRWWSTTAMLRGNRTRREPCCRGSRTLWSAISRPWVFISV